jgi:diadenosine tetraphosphate (Ap4A) HIT family hydrolase
MAGCCFCNSLVRGASEAPWDVILRDSGRFIVTPTKGALVPGWLLVVAKRHALCAGMLTADELRELEICLAEARLMVEERFGEATVFEHGPCRPDTSLGCGIDHLHIHVAPLSFSLRKAVDDLFPATEWQLISDFSGTKALFEKGVGYAVVHEPQEQIRWCQPPVGVRQLLRRAIASRLGVPSEFDYAEFPHLPNVMLTLQNLRNASS